MFDPVSRRGFVGLATAAGAMLVTRRSWAAQASAASAGEWFPTTAPERAREMVGASHNNIERVRELLAEDRGLCLATWDWGFGDWESALGAASHVGNKEIAELLLDHGARADLFALAMLDRVDAVRAVCQALPGVQGVRGPHGFTLLHHARAGRAERVREYLENLGGADIRETDLGLDEAGAGVYVGVFAGGGVSLEVRRARNGGIELLREGGSARRLNRVGEHTFSPVGAPQVEVMFEVEGSRASALSVMRGKELLRARRAG